MGSLRGEKPQIFYGESKRGVSPKHLIGFKRDKVLPISHREYLRGVNSFFYILTRLLK